MKSRYLAALNMRIDVCPPGLERYCLQAERAAYLARLGEVVASREEIALIRSNYQKEGDARLSILVNIADGLSHYYQHMGAESRDRLSRAHALAVATGAFDLASRTAAWLALLAYGAYDFNGMAHFLSRSLTTGILDPIAISRNALTIALATHLANRFDLAKVWYQRARHAASDIEDDAMISAIMHNMSSIWVANLRNFNLGGIETADKSSVALLGVLSTMNFDELMGATSQPDFTPLIQAQLLSIEGKCEEALAIYGRHIDRLNIDAVHGWQKWLLADRAWCLLKTGYADNARVEFDTIQGALSNADHVDDRAAALRRLADGYALLGMVEESIDCRAKSDDGWRSFQRLQENILSVTKSFPLSLIEK